MVGWTALGIFAGGAIGAAIGYGIGGIITNSTGVLGFSFVKGNIFVVTKTMVIGHYGYTTLGVSLGYGYYQISKSLYDSLSYVQKWAHNSQFLFDCSKLGANFIVEPNRVIESSCWLYSEIAYLLEKGYYWLEDLSALVR